MLQFFKDQGLFKPTPRIIGMSNPSQWIFDNFYKLIDEGGTYRAANPVFGKSMTRNYTEEESKKLLATDLDLVKNVVSYSLLS